MAQYFIIFCILSIQINQFNRMTYPINRALDTFKFMPTNWMVEIIPLPGLVASNFKGWLQQAGIKRVHTIQHIKRKFINTSYEVAFFYIISFIDLNSGDSI